MHRPDRKAQAIFEIHTDLRTDAFGKSHEKVAVPVVEQDDVIILVEQSKGLPHCLNRVDKAGMGNGGFLLALGQRGFGPLAFGHRAELGADMSHGLDDLDVRRGALLGKELQHADDTLLQHDGKSHARGQSRLLGKLDPWEIRLLR